MRIFDFLNILTLLMIFTGVVALIDWLWRRRRPYERQPGLAGLLVEYARSFFPVFLAVVLVRAFVFQPYRVPSGSLEPTVIPGDFIFVTQFNYGLKLPLWDKTIVSVGHPERGQIALFRWPVNPALTFVKRVIGVPGDHISYVNKILTVNGQVCSQQYVGAFNEIMGDGRLKPVNRYRENLRGVQHDMIVDPAAPAIHFKDLVVPKGMYFMMGDNRDDSDDSRSWGFVPQENFIGRARYVWFNVQWHPWIVRWERIGLGL